MIAKLSNILKDINTVLLPPVCFGCNARLYRGEHFLCTLCRNQLPLTEFNFTEENAVDRIFYGRVRIEKAAAFLFYGERGIVKNLIHYLKYRNQPEIGAFLGHWWGSELRANGFGKDLACIIPVPLHPAKKRQRGYNQVSRFAEALGEELRVPCLETVLIKKARGSTQTRKNRWYRWQSSVALYHLADPRPIRGRNVLLVDDVITTGATMEACAQALLSADKCRVFIASMSVVP